MPSTTETSTAPSAPLSSWNGTDEQHGPERPDERIACPAGVAHSLTTSPPPDPPGYAADSGGPQVQRLAPYREHLVYWKQRLDGAATLLNLPIDRPRPVVQSYREARQSFELDEVVAPALRELSRREQVTLFETLLAAFQLLLSRYSRQEDIVVGVPVAVRAREGLEVIPGPSANTLPVRTQLSGDPVFRELLRRVARTLQDSLLHADVPWELLVGVLRREGDLGHGSLFQVVFLLQNAPPCLLTPGEMAVSRVIPGNARPDLALALVEGGDRLAGTVEYNADLFEAATIARLLGHFQMLLLGIVADPGQRVSELPLLTEAERRQLLFEWNETATGFPNDTGVHELFEARVEKTPDAIAAIYAEERLSYAELNARANQVAWFLRRLGVGPETLVGLAVERSLELVVGLLGVLKAGGAYVPLDPAYPEERLSFLLQDSQIPILLTQHRLVANLPAHQARVICLDSDWKSISGEGTANPPRTVSGDNLAYVIYTSGSTGKPKGIMVPHRGLVNYLSWCVDAYAAEAGTGAPVCSSISFDLTVTSLFAPLLAGRAVELFPPCRDVELLREGFRTARDYSLVKITPAHLELLGKQISAEEACGRTRAFIIGGENLTARQIQFWQEHAPDTTLVNEYGPTETVVGCCIYQVPPGKHQSGSIPIGRPIANTQLYVLDPQRRLVPIGVPGELYIGGAGLARGYFQRPELTAERFVPHPFSKEPGARLYKTGDLVRWLPDGNLEFLGRLDEQIKYNGYRIEPGEIEAALVQHPSVREAVAVLREDRPGNKRLVAYLVLRQERGQVPADLRSFLKQKLPPYMVPSAFVVLPRIPLTPNSKVDRQALPMPEPDRPEFAHAYAAPRTPVEESLAGLWKELLGIDRVGIRDDFFALGGNSLLAVELFAQIERVFGSRLPLAILLQGATIEHLAKALQDPVQAGPGIEIVAIQPGTSRTALFFVPSVGCELLYCQAIAKHLGPEQPVYGIQPCARNGKVQQPASVEDIAADYVRALRAFQPQGPYALAGFSFAGTVAFEMARQLTTLGAEVGLLGIIDISPSRSPIRTAREIPQAVLASLFNLPFWLKDDLLQTPAKEMLARIRRRLNALRHRVFSSSHRTPESSDLELLFDVRRLPDHYRRLIEANLRASHNYVPKPYAGRLTLFRARAQPLVCWHKADLGWGSFALGGVATRIIPGTHDSILKEPHVKTLAEELRAALAHGSA
jgi:amino acid adenylation domain-containing protein